MKKNTFLYLFVIFLVVINIIFLVLFIRGSGTENKSKPEEFIAKELNFNEKQLEKVRDINKNHDEERILLADEARTLKDVLFSKIEDKSITKKEVDSISSLIGKNEQAEVLMVFYHFKDIRAICNENQKAQFDKVIENGLHKGRGKNGPPRGGREDGPPPGRRGGDDRGPRPPRD